MCELLHTSVPNSIETVQWHCRLIVLTGSHYEEIALHSASPLRRIATRLDSDPPSVSRPSILIE
jgi:hypothetical protein